MTFGFWHLEFYRFGLIYILILNFAFCILNFYCMHSVLKNLLQRSGKSVLVNDGRKIALIAFGGNMTGVLGGAALQALEDVGLSYAFDEVYATSAGFPNVCYFLTKSTYKGLPVYWNELVQDRKFINPFRFWKVVDIDYLIDIFRSGDRKLDVYRVLHHPSRIYVKVKNVSLKKFEFLEIVRDMSEDDFWKVMKATISIPFLNPGKVKIGKYKYMDSAFYNDSLPFYVNTVLSKKYLTDILIILNNPYQVRQLKDVLEFIERNMKERVCIIYPKFKHTMSHFETNPDIIRENAEYFKEYVKSLFNGS